MALMTCPVLCFAAPCSDASIMCLAWQQILDSFPWIIMKKPMVTYLLPNRLKGTK